MTDYLTTLARKYAANYKGLSKHCWQGIMLICINTLTIGICFFLSLYFVTIRQFTPSMAGLLLSCYGMGTVLGGLITGKLSDTFSPHLISISSLLVQSTTFFLLTYLHSVFALMANMFLLGFAAYGFKTSNNVWMLSLCRNDTNLRYKTISISHVAANFGLGLSGVLIASMTTYGFKSIFYLSSLLLLCSALYLLFQKNTSTTVLLPIKGQHYYEYSNASQIIILLVIACVFLVGLIIAQLSTTYPLYIQKLFPHLGIRAVSILFILDTFLIVFFQAPLTTLVGGQNKLLVTGIGALLMGIGMLVLSYSSVFVLAIFSCIIWTTGEMLFISTAQLLCYEQSSNQKKGQSLGLFQTAFAISNVIGPAVGGIIYQNWGGNLLWYCSMFIGTMCFFLCWYGSRTYTNTSS
ncbi:MFS transporter [Legionella qingyii]|uniref:MFS transporter n=1 Tax=Legionella qingyii TaxID=2184757 RepID=A0A317U2E1_9GAMM|nr:MFS transporter [Legionella qingyii]PWY54652.1 MFS transporter [Legionella qingyii]RUR20490.1 MFS transporter [Legionella qingyii]RUR22633.1 MFS transporter [Legionella qingyii]